MNIAPLKVSLLSLALLLSPVASLPAHAACTANLALQPASSLPALGGRLEIGRASCRERVCLYV